MSLLSPVSLSQKATSVADTGDAHKKKDAPTETRSGGIDPGFLKGISQTSLPLKHCKLVTGRFDAFN
jgi:hypothetical protein